MRYVIEQYWLWSVVALVLGLTTGWVAARQPNAARSSRWVQTYILLAAVGGAVAYSGLVRGVAGLWFETFVLLGAVALAGCIVGSLLAPPATNPASDAAPSP